jgi:hypothetical protein
MKTLFKSTFLIFSILGVFSSFLMVAQAENIVDVSFPCPGSDIPGFPECERQKDGVVDNDFVGYVIRIYQFGIGIVGIVAVGMIVYGGILIAWNTESIDKKGKGREMITSALIGVAVLFGSYLILNTINPQLVRFDLAGTVPDKKGTSTLTGTAGEALKGIKLCGTAGDPTTITRWPNFTDSPTCEYRKMTYNGTEKLKIGNDGRYYDEWVEEEIPPNSMIWSYPYFITEEGTSTARCLIYAYKDLNINESSIEKIDLDNDLSICSLDPNKKLKNEEDTFGEGCKDCVELQKDNRISVKPGICGGETCMVNKDLQWKLGSLADAIIDWQITEAHPPTVPHKSLCHNNGTCVDANFSPPLSPGGYTQDEAKKISAFLKEAKLTGLIVIYEVGNPVNFTRLKALTDEYSNSIVFNEGVADHFHIR